MWEQYWEDRGSPWEHDPGPAKNRSWSRLFAETPNYRSFGIAMSMAKYLRSRRRPVLKNEQRDRAVFLSSASPAFAKTTAGRPDAAAAKRIGAALRAAGGDVRFNPIEWANIAKAYFTYSRPKC